MPTLSEIQSKSKIKFKKRDYRVWNMEGTANTSALSILDVNDGTVSKDNQTHFIETISPHIIKNWEMHDRPESELGDIDSLARDFLEIGQHQPCIVRPIKDKQFQYELIAGERRWRAAIKAEVDLKVIVKNISDQEAALIQSSENINRKDLSDYAKGMSYSRLLEKGILCQTDLVEKLNISKQNISRYLSFSKIPSEVSEKIQDFSKISAGTAEKIKQLCDKGNLYIKAIIHYSSLLREGKIGHNKLTTLVEHYILKGNSSRPSTHKVYTNNNRLLFTWRREKSMYLSIHFPKDITTLLDSQKMSSTDIDDTLKKLIEKKLMDI
jgi:ParB family chromosome partitioning protein